MAVSFSSNVLITSADMAASFNSDEIFLEKKDGYAIQAVFTGSPVGSLYISVSINGTDWTVLADSPQAISAAGDVVFEVTTSKYLVAKVYYARTSGTGTMNVWFSTKASA
jgi:hypothetical protein